MKYTALETATLLERVGRLIQNQGTAEGLNPVQWETLRYFGAANRFSRSPSALTEYLGVTKGTVSQTINAIERKGLLKKLPVPSDARAVNIELTQSGLKILGRDPLAALVRDLEELGVERQKYLNMGLRHVLEASLRSRGGSAFGMCETCRHFEVSHEDGNPHRCGLLGAPLSEEDSSLICREHAA